MKAAKLIEEANELLMQLRVKSVRQVLTEHDLYGVQMLLYRALDDLKVEPVSANAAEPEPEDKYPYHTMD